MSANFSWNSTRGAKAIECFSNGKSWALKGSNLRPSLENNELLGMGFKVGISNISSREFKTIVFSQEDNLERTLGTISTTTGSSQSTSFGTISQSTSFGPRHLTLGVWGGVPANFRVRDNKLTFYYRKFIRRCMRTHTNSLYYQIDCEIRQESSTWNTNPNSRAASVFTKHHHNLRGSSTSSFAASCKKQKDENAKNSTKQNTNYAV